MTIVNFVNARQPIDMAYANLVSFSNNPFPNTPEPWHYFTPAGHHLELYGDGVALDTAGRATAGTIHTIHIDLGNNNPFTPDVTISGLEAEAAGLDDGVAGFWSILAGNDTIIGPDKDRVGLGGARLYGDCFVAEDGAAGGHDTIDAGDASLRVSGDALFVQGGNAPAPLLYSGGRDFIFGFNTGEKQFIAGDALAVDGHAKLTGGADVIRARNFHEDSSVAGDVDQVGGEAGAIAEVVGGNDDIDGGPFFQGELYGDVGTQLAHSVVRGGNDLIVSNSQFDLKIAGDVGAASDGVVITGGNDTIHGGSGSDSIWGECASGAAILSGGNDILHGHGGDDLIRGQSGNDVLDGGEGADDLAGGTGNDTYVTDSFADIVAELAGEGTDTIRTTLNDVQLVANVENLTYIGTGSFRGGGNALSNRITGGNGADIFIADGSGNDVFNGRGGFDILDFRGLGAAVINLATDVHGGSAAGDSFSSIESILGSATGADRMTGGTARAIFSGFGGNDVLRGGAQADVLHGGDGNGRLEGRAGNDIFLNGEAGNDTIMGGAGKDILSGGSGNDRFDYAALTDGGDTIADFANAAGDNDSLRFDGDGFGGLSAGALAANRFVANAGGQATTADQRFVYETDTGILRFDANGSAADGVTIVATLTGAPALAAGDVFII